MGSQYDWQRESKLAGPAAEIADGEPLRSPIKFQRHNAAFEANVKRVMNLIWDMGLPADVTRRACPVELIHESIIVIQTAAARVEMERFLEPKVDTDEAGNMRLSITPEQVRARLARLEMSQQEFAIEAGYTAGHFSNVMRGRYPWTDKLMADVLSALLRLEGALR